MEILSQAFTEFSRELDALPSTSQPFRQDPELRAAIERIYRDAQENNKSDLTNNTDLSLPNRKLNLHEVKKMIKCQRQPLILKQELQPTEVLEEAVTKRKAVIKTIEDTLAEINKTALDGGTPKLILRNQTLWSNCVYDSDRVTLKPFADAKKCNITYSSTNDQSKFNAVVFVLTKVHDLLAKNLTCTRRELYYQNVSRLRSQGALDMAVRDVCCLLDTPPWDLGLTATAKGLVAGPLTIVTREGTTIDCMTPGGTLIPQDVFGIQSFKSSAKYILVVEKDAIFQRLLDEGALMRLGPVIIITGKGYPDVSTRLLLCRLCTDLLLPALALVDADPHGLEIFLTYKYGSLAQSHLSNSLACARLALLGARCEDVRALAPLNARLPLTLRDQRKLRALITRPYLAGPSGARVAAELNAALRSGHKAELESVGATSATALSDTYLRARLLHGDFIA